MSICTDKFGVEFSPDRKTIKKAPLNIIKYEIPDSVTEIGADAFRDCYNLTSLIIPDSVTEIGASAFHFCMSLTSVTIPDSVTEIGEGVFCDCHSLSSIVIPNSISEIKNNTFCYCFSLRSIEIPNSVTELGDWAFASCKILDPVTIPDSVTKIGECAFLDCYLLSSITIPDSVTKIGDNAFGRCLCMTSLVIPQTGIDIGIDAFNDCASLITEYLQVKSCKLGYPESIKKRSAYFLDLKPLIGNQITVIGIGERGSNVVDRIYKTGIEEAEFCLFNADQGSMNSNSTPVRVLIEKNNSPNAEDLSDLGQITGEYDKLKMELTRSGVRMLFLIPSTVSDAASRDTSIIASIAKEMGILTIAVVALPFRCEGEHAREQAVARLEALRQSVGTTLVINSDDVVNISEKMQLSETVGKVDDFLAMVTMSAENIIKTGGVTEIWFSDMRAMMQNGYIALVGSAQGGGENRAQKTLQLALSSSSLKEVNISDAKTVLLNITSGHNSVTLKEVYDITDSLQNVMSDDSDLIWGSTIDKSLGDDIRITIIASGFEIQNYSCAEKTDHHFAVSK